MAAALVATPVVARSAIAQRRASPTQFTAAQFELYSQVLRAGDQRALDSAALDSALRDRNPALRRVAALTLAQLAPTHRERALPWLRSLATNQDTAVVARAVFGLGLAHDTASVGLLASSVRHSGAVARAAAWSLGELGAPAAGSITKLLASARHEAASARNGDVVTVALLIAASKERPLDYPSVAPFLETRDSVVRWAAAYAIARQRAPAGARALIDAKNGNAALRAEVARELTSRTTGDSLRPAALVRLRRLASDPDPHIRINAVQSLGTYGSAARANIIAAFHDRDPNVRIAAAAAAGRALSSDTSAWHAAWRADTGYKFRKSLLQSADAVNIELPATHNWLTSPDWRFRAAAVSAWSGAADSTRVRDVGLAATADPDGRVRAAAYELLAASDTAKRDSLVQHALTHALSDSDTVARESIPGYHAPGGSGAAKRPLSWYSDVVRRIVLPSLNGRTPHVTIATVRGPITLKLYGADAPLTTANFVALAEKHFYDGARFHRVVPGFVAQDGDPRGDGNGGPGYAIRDELTLLPYERGTVGMALSGPDTGGSQYFLTLTPQPHLTGHYPVFGKALTGFDVMDALVEGDLISTIRVQW